MAREKLFLDTSYILAHLNPKDSLHNRAEELFPRFQQAEIWVTEAVLTEVGNAFSKGRSNRTLALDFIEDCIEDYLITVVNVAPDLFDKPWSCTRSDLTKHLGWWTASRLW